MQFTDALKNIRDMGLEEARRLLLCKLPDWMRVWVVEEENKKTTENPVLIFCRGAGDDGAASLSTRSKFNW